MVRSASTLERQGIDDGIDSTSLVDSISHEFDSRLSAVRRDYTWRLEREKASHRLEMAKQRVNLLEVCMCFNSLYTCCVDLCCVLLCSYVEMISWAEP